MEISFSQDAAEWRILLFETVKIPRTAGRVKVHSTSKSKNAYSNVLPLSQSSENGAVQVASIQSLSAVGEHELHEAYQKGIEEGRKRTSELLQSEYSARVESECQRIDQFLSTIKEQLSTIGGNAESALLRFSLGVAEQIVRQQIKTNPEIVLNTIKDSIKKIFGVERIKIRINPIDMNIAQEGRSGIQSISQSLREIVFESDASIESGGCIIESDLGNVDGRISMQLEQIAVMLDEHQSGN